MNLLCINQPSVLIKSGQNDTAKIYVGNMYTLEYAYDYFGETYFKLAEVEGAMFYEGHFATLPNATADEMEEESKEAIVNLETVMA